MGKVVLLVENGVAWLTLDAPPMNAMTRGMVSELDGILKQCDDNAKVRSLVLKGAGHRAFCAGTDLNELQQLLAQGPESLAQKFLEDETVFGALARFRKPTVCAIDGAAIGGGLEMAVCCDFIVAARTARFALPEIRLGVFPGSGGTVRVTQRIGAARARRMMLLGDQVDAETALAWGLIDEISEGSAVDAASTLAGRLAAGPALAMRGCKAAIQAAIDQDEVTAMAASRSWSVRLGFTADAAEGLSAFESKRVARFVDQVD